MAIMNYLKTVILLGSLTGLFLLAGSFFGTTGLIIGLVFALVMNFGSYWFSDKIILKMYNAKEVTKSQDPALYSTVKNIAEEANIPVPKIYIIDTQTSNAFATGRNPENSAIALTKGIIELLNEEELKGVIAHELAHIKNRDTLIATIAATIAGVISFIASMAQWAAIFGGFGGSDDDGPGLVQMLFLAILTPIIATIIQLAISRSREYHADASAAKYLKNSKGLSEALQKISQDVKRMPMKEGNQTTASLFIINPFKARNFMKLFSTHPATEDRIARLNKIKV
jgi:heat shock protein HtpX